MHEFIISVDFTRYVCPVFGVTKCTPAQRAVAVQLATSLYWQFFDHLIDVMKLRQEEGIPFDVEQMGGVGDQRFDKLVNGQ